MDKNAELYCMLCCVLAGPHRGPAEGPVQQPVWDPPQCSGERPEEDLLRGPQEQRSDRAAGRYTGVTGPGILLYHPVGECE